MGVFKSLSKVAIGVIKLPVDAAADVVTMGGLLNDKEKPHTVKGLKDIMDNLNKAVDPKN